MYLNANGVDLSLAVWLATDNYDHDDTTVSATALLKPTKALILAGRVPKDQSLPDVISMLKSRIGTAIHDSIEAAWTHNAEQALNDLGFSKSISKNIVINPENEIDLDDDAIPVYMEQRLSKEFMGFTITGKYDFIAEGVLNDFKSTGTFTYLKGNKDKDYSLQGSIYRWLDNGNLITEDTMKIQFIFTDWKQREAMQNPKYPKLPVLAHPVKLMTMNETEEWVAAKLAEVSRFHDSPESEMPRCTKEQLWQDEPVFKYYKNPANAEKEGGRSTKNFDNPEEAYARLDADGGVGVVVEVQGKVRACNYCDGAPVCLQREEYASAGLL